MLSKEEGKELLSLARSAIKSYFSKSKPDFGKYEKYNEKQGVFVTLNYHGSLRGCIGFPYPVYPLKKAIFDAARAAAFDDPRFPPLQEIELRGLKIDVSVLSVPEEIKVKTPLEYQKIISIGKDGLIVKSRFASGLLLPQVFTENGCTPLQALEMTCEKAGLPKDAWKDLSNRFYRFQAQVFSED